MSARTAAGERISVSGQFFMLVRGTQKLEVVSAWSYSRCHATQVVFSVSRIDE